jgi:hypothetical protein
MDPIGPKLIPQKQIAVSYLDSEQLLLITVPHHLIQELIDAVGEEHVLARAIRMQVEAAPKVEHRAPEITIEDLTN